MWYLRCVWVRGYLVLGCRRAAVIFVRFTVPAGDFSSDDCSACCFTRPCRLHRPFTSVAPGSAGLQRHPNLTGPQSTVYSPVNQSHYALSALEAWSEISSKLPQQSDCNCSKLGILEQLLYYCYIFYSFCNSFGELHATEELLLLRVF